MSVHREYNQKCVTPETAVKHLIGAKNLILGMSVAMPPALMHAVANAAKNKEINPLNLYYMHGTQSLMNSLLRPELREQIRPRPLFMSEHDRQAIKESDIKHWIQFVPSTFHQVGRLLTKHIEPDCFMVTVSRMDQHGYFSLGTNADYGATVIRKAKKVIVEVNNHMPRTFGECSVHISEVHAIVENHVPLIEFLPQKDSQTDITIARQIVEKINDGDTLQAGVGGVPNVILKSLKNHKNLGLHSELFSPAIADLIKSGVINGRMKSWLQHKHVFTLALGDKTMYEFMDDNPSIVGYPASWVNNPSIIRKNKNMVSINSAIEVDLTGQINSEQINGIPFSGTGGQLDFVRGAYAAENGRSFIALHSTAKNDSISRIVPILNGGTVTDTRMDTHYIVTEFGMVDLKGLSIQERVRAILNLAHPSFRETLEKQAYEKGLLA